MDERWKGMDERWKGMNEPEDTNDYSLLNIQLWILYPSFEVFAYNFST